MTEPARWSSLNESEREVLRLARKVQSAPVHLIEDAEDLLSCAACKLTSDDPPEEPIEMPEDWADRGADWSDDTEVSIGKPEVCNDATEEVACYITTRKSRGGWAPISILALALRSAGWRVEGPRG